MTLKTAAAKFALNAINKFISAEHLASVELLDLHIAAGKLTDALEAEQAQAVAIHGFKASRSENGAVFLEPTSPRPPRTAQEFKFGMEVLNWNRAQQDPPIDVGRELWVADEVFKMQVQAVEPVAYLIDWPDEPELGHYFSESATESGRSTPLCHCHPAPPSPAGEAPAGIKELLSEKPITGPCGQCKSSADPCYCGNVNTGESKMVSGRSELIAWLREKYQQESCGESGLKDAADMLEADAQELSTAFERVDHWSVQYQDVRNKLLPYQLMNAQQVAVPTGCHRSHPHEEMNQVCKLKTEIARLKAAHKVDRDDLNRLDEQRLESLRAVEGERNAALGQIATMTKDPSWFELKAERDALAADAERYRWLRRSATRLSFDNALIGSLVRDQAELDGAMEAA